MGNISKRRESVDFSSDVIAFSQETTLHGLNHITQSRKSVLQRLAWILIFVGAVSLFLFFVTTGTIRYFSYPVVSTIVHHYVDTMELPSVTVCNENRIRNSFLEQLNIVNISQLGVEVHYADEEAMFDEYVVDDPEHLNTMDIKRMIMVAAHQYTGTVLSCTIGESDTCPYESRFGIWLQLFSFLWHTVPA